MIEEIKSIAESLDRITKTALEQYTPLVNDILASNCNDTQKIERVLDGLLDFCFDNRMLLLYRKLCRQLYTFDPNAAVYYVNAYREMYDEDGTHFGRER